MRAYFIDSKTDEHNVIDIEPTLDEYYRLIDCTCVDIIMREIDGHPYNIVLDDMGLLVPNRIAAISVTSNLFGDRERIAWNLLIFGVDTEDLESGLKSLTDDEVRQIERRMIQGLFRDGMEHPVLFYTR